MYSMYTTKKGIMELWVVFAAICCLVLQFLGQSRGSCTGGVLGQGHTEQHHRMLEFATIEIHIIYIYIYVCMMLCA